MLKANFCTLITLTPFNGFAWKFGCVVPLVRSLDVGHFVLLGYADSEIQTLVKKKKNLCFLLLFVNLQLQNGLEFFFNNFVFQKEYPNMSMPEVAKICSDEYQKLPEKRKAKFKAR